MCELSRILYISEPTVRRDFSFVDVEAERFFSAVCADVLFFSCRRLSDTGEMTDRSTGEASLHRKMFERCKTRVLLCSGSKIGKTCFYSMGSIADVDHVIIKEERPPALAAPAGKNR